jgi:hypothetical protein
VEAVEVPVQTLCKKMVLAAALAEELLVTAGTLDQELLDKEMQVETPYQYLLTPVVEVELQQVVVQVQVLLVVMVVLV